MSSTAMPFTTWLPRNGGSKIGLSVDHVGRPVGDRRRVGGRRVAARRCGRGPRGTVPQSGSSSPVAPDLAEAVHDPQALEGVLAVEEPALVDLAQVALDVAAGERGAAEQHRDVGSSRSFSSSRFSRMISVRLDQQAAHADGVGARPRRPSRSSRRSADLDAEVVDRRSRCW